MRTNNLSKLILLPLLAFSILQSEAQLSSCGDLKIDTVALQKALQFERLRQQNGRTQVTNFLIRVYFHIGALNDGSNPVTTLTTLKQEFDTLRADYAGAGICFIFSGYDFVNNSNLDTNFNANTDNPNLFDPYRIPSCINIFYVQQIKGTNTACANNCGLGGTSLSIPSTFCLISSGNIGSIRTISHEVGHCMGLLHTFEKNHGFENIDGSKSSTAGDLITDTPADPYGFNGNPCFAFNGCTYQGNCTDPNGETNYIPPYSNLMAYWIQLAGRSCVPIVQLTLNQYSRVYSFLSTDAPLMSCGTPDANFVIANTSKSSGYFFWSATNTISTSGNVNLTGTLKSSLGSQVITLQPGFHAGVAAGGRVIITAKICN